MIPLSPAEKTRTYVFPSDQKITLQDVTHFMARSTGTHRLKTGDGKLHIVPTGWLHIEIEAEGWTL